jgi:hypothetical protein
VAAFLNDPKSGLCSDFLTRAGYAFRERSGCHRIIPRGAQKHRRRFVRDGKISRLVRARPRTKQAGERRTTAFALDRVLRFRLAAMLTCGHAQDQMRSG